MKNEFYYDELIAFKDLNFRKNIEMVMNGKSVKLLNVVIY